MNSKFIEREVHNTNNKKFLKKKSREASKEKSPNNRKLDPTCINQLCEQEYDRLEKINKLENAIIDLKERKIIYRKNFNYILNNIYKQKKSKHDLMKIYSFSLRNKFNEFIFAIKKIIYSYSLKKISYTYLYSVSIRNTFFKFKKQIYFKKLQNKISFFEQKKFYEKIIRNFIFDFSTYNKNENKQMDKNKKDEIEKIKIFIENVFDLKNNLDRYSEIIQKFNNSINNPFNIEFDLNFYLGEINKLDFSELIIDHRYFVKNKNSFFKKILFKNLSLNKNNNICRMKLLQEKYNDNLKLRCFKIINLCRNKKHKISDSDSEFNLIKKQNVYLNTIKKLKKVIFDKNRKLDFLIKKIRFVKKAAIKYFFSFTLNIRNMISKLKEKLNISKYSFLKRILWNKLKLIKQKLKDSKAQLELVKKGKMKRIIDVLMKNHLFKKDFKNKCLILYNKIEKIFLRRSFNNIVKYPSLLKQISKQNKQIFSRKLFFLKTKTVLNLRQINNYLRYLQNNSSLTKVTIKISLMHFLKITRRKTLNDKNQRMAYFYYKRKTKLKFFDNFKKIANFLISRKEKYITALINFRNNYIKKALNAFKINLSFRRQKNKIYKNLLKDRDQCIYANIFNKILCRVSTSLALSKDVFQNRYFDIIKQLKNEKINFDNYVLAEDYNDFHKNEEKASIQKMQTINYTNREHYQNMNLHLNGKSNTDFEFYKKFSDKEKLSIYKNENMIKFNNYYPQENNIENYDNPAHKSKLNFTNYINNFKNVSSGKPNLQKELNENIVSYNIYNNIGDINREHNEIYIENHDFYINKKISPMKVIKLEEKSLNKYENENKMGINRNNNFDYTIKINNVNEKFNKVNDDIRLLLEMRNKKKSEPILNK